ncbi:phytoene/squalene synthase family protein [Halosimplex rubrum]|uniref:Phytoene/squalene synthase family protein n=1 Tax=Halosimplex rubrum TaxID=869889 RepID=A0A7D5NZI9_9EURY|nr:phytoene/squalene synthase family protein [Halosimplex rubrum]QLH77146.1 phytoene/squalene synthase family protein [Halosimplex rubrum]
MPASDQVDTSKQIHRRTGRTFYAATKLLPERVRETTYVLYAFFRIADEVVDRTDDPDPQTQRRRLEAMRAAALGEPDPGVDLTEDERAVLDAFRSLADRTGIDDSEIEVFVDAMLQDIETARYPAYEDLEGYMRGSSVAVANMMMAAMEMPAEDREQARPHAEALAEAFQLTNFLRDVREDIRDYGRVYVPGETLARFDVEESDLAEANVTDGFVAAMRHELQRTERRYREGVAGIRMLPEDCQFGVLLAAVFYAEHHRLIRARDYDVLTETPELGRLRRGYLLVRTWIHWRRHRDPEATFYAVSAVSPGGEGDGVETDGVTSHVA